MQERQLALAELHDADAVLLAGALRGVERVEAVDGRRLGGVLAAGLPRIFTS